MTGLPWVIIAVLVLILFGLLTRDIDAQIAKNLPPYSISFKANGRVIVVDKDKNVFINNHKN